MDVTSATNERTMVSSVVRDAPCSNSVPVLNTAATPWLLAGALNCIGYDYVARLRCSGVHLNYFTIEDSPLPSQAAVHDSLGALSLRLLGVSAGFSDAWLLTAAADQARFALRSLWAVSAHERSRLQASADAIGTALLGLNFEDVSDILDGCDRPVGKLDDGKLAPNGFWRVDKDKHPELRQTVLTLVALHDLEEKIRDVGGDRMRGIDEFLAHNEGQGWMVPETLRLADFGLGHDDRAREHQPVATSFGARFYDWQLAQDAEESWRECHVHARNLLGESGYRQLIADIEADNAGEVLRVAQPPPTLAAGAAGQARLWE